MTREFFNKQFAALVVAYPTGSKLPDETGDVYFEMLKDLASDRFVIGVKACIAGGKYFPTVSELIAASAAPALPAPDHLAPWQRWKTRAAGSQYFEDAMAVLNSAGKVTRQAYLEMLLGMEEKYPGVGWKEQMDELERFYFKYGMSLKDKPRIESLEIPGLIEKGA